MTRIFPRRIDRSHLNDEALEETKRPHQARSQGNDSGLSDDESKNDGAGSQDSYAEKR